MHTSIGFPVSLIIIISLWINWKIKVNDTHESLRFSKAIKHNKKFIEHVLFEQNIFERLLIIKQYQQAIK